MSMNDLFGELGGDFSEFMGLYMMSYMCSLCFASIFGIVNYIFQGLTLSTVARRRGINNPWLAWVPVGNVWMLGCISDQYRYVAKGQVKNRRKTMLVLEIVGLVMTFVLLAMSAVVLVQCFNAFAMEMTDDAAAASMMVLCFVMLAVCYGMLAVAIVLSVHQYIALFDYYRSTDPKRSLLYFLLSFIGYPMPFLMFICRNKDGGMPPRQEPQEPQELPPVAEY